jgi:ABC-type lipoprotein export system ATPase subunit
MSTTSISPVKSQQTYPRGSEWRQWDFHVHTPASFEWRGRKFSSMSETEKMAEVDEMIKAMNNAEPAVFVLMDYWTFDGWLALKKRLAQENAPTLSKLVLPGIELRLVAPTPYRLNAHVIFADDVSDQDLLNFKTELKVALIEQPLSDDCLRRLARTKLGSDLLAKHSLKREILQSDDASAFEAGCKCAEIVSDSYKSAISKVPDGKAIAFIPWDTYNGLAEAEWAEHYAYVIGLMHSSPIFETRRQEQWEAFVGLETDKNRKWFASFQAALGNKPHLAVSGSDAHSFNDYGNFPNGKATWIKADPTFCGLLQSIREPAKRSFIGSRPPKLASVDENKTFFIDTIKVEKTVNGSSVGKWLDGCELTLNPDLVAIIGNKGSGKSALADVIALLGNSRQKAHFSFLKKDRFRGKSGEPARNFVGSLIWCDKSIERRNLNEDPASDKAELVRYIPQGHFEDLCNDHVSGQTNAFEHELRAVIFSHASETIRLGALDFDQLIEQQESSFRLQLNDYRNELKKVNQDISSVEDQLQPEVKRSLLELQILKERQIDEHNKIKPESIQAPSTELTEEQREATIALEAIAKRIKELGTNASSNAGVETALTGKLRAIQSVSERLRLLDRSYSQFVLETKTDVELLGLNVLDLAALKINEAPLNDCTTVIQQKLEDLKQSVKKDADEKAILMTQQIELNTKLNAPQLLYQQRLRQQEEWEAKLIELNGTPDAPETLQGIKTRIAQIDSLPGKLAELKDKRLKLSGDIFDILDTQRKARERLFKPVQDLIQTNNLIRDEYKLQFQATLSASSEAISASLFAIIKQNAGEFRGEDESYATIKKIAESYDFNKREETVSFITTLHDRICMAAASQNKGAVGITNILRKERSASEVYDLLFGLAFLAPRYSLLFQDTKIEQLSPGQRGALLLIFYLLVDKGHNPIILDQPEENLDNETVVSLLVPVLAEAKKRRQVIMVTHNPNLAVVCDAEQVIYSSFDRKNESKISYLPGAIENPAINLHVVNVLEGTKPAFDNRRVKYH